MVDGELYDTMQLGLYVDFILLCLYAVVFLFLLKKAIFTERITLLTLTLNECHIYMQMKEYPRDTLFIYQFIHFE